MSFSFRPNTTDQQIYTHVAIDNEYRLPKDLSHAKIVLDIGAHIGSFSYSALNRGARKVWAYEADSENAKQTTNNLQTFISEKKLVLRRAAIWRSDVQGAVMYHGGYSQEEAIVNTGGTGVFWAQEGEGEALPTISFDDVIDEITENGKQEIDLLKIDCEGSEWPILLTSQKLGLIKFMCGEFHELGGKYNSTPAPFDINGKNTFTTKCLRDKLRQAGFSVVFHRGRNGDDTLSSCGLFFATQAPYLSKAYWWFLLRYGAMISVRRHITSLQIFLKR